MLRRVLKRAELPYVRFHDLRHTFASLLINQDVPLINVSNFLGHSDLSTTANIYAHLDKGQQAGQRRCDFGHSPRGAPARPAEGRTRNQYRQTNVKGAPLWDALIL